VANINIAAIRNPKVTLVEIAWIAGTREHSIEVEYPPDPLSKSVLIFFKLLPVCEEFIHPSNFPMDCKFNHPTKSSKHASADSPHNSDEKTDLLTIREFIKCKRESSHIFNS
jgi:hypothetical protein